MSGMIVAPQPIAVEAGARVLMDGGNAVDAAVTCAFVQAVVSPQMCGIGGYAILTLHLRQPTAASGFSSIALDAPALAGSRVAPDMWRNEARIPEFVCAGVRKRHPIERLPQSHGGLALVHAIALDSETGALAGAADTGSGGMALRV